MCLYMYNVSHQIGNCTQKMDYLSLLLALPVLLTCIHFLTKSHATRKFSRVNLPPGPRPLPIIGNFLQLGSKPHQALANLSKIYGPIMTVNLGGLTTIVFSSPDMAKEVLHTHDQALSSRIISDNLRALDHTTVSVMWLPISAPWRNLRKVCAIQIFSTKRLDASETIRRKKVRELLDYVHENCSSGSAVDIGQAAFTTVLNSISNTVFSIDLADHHHSDRSQNFYELVSIMLEEIGTPNLSYFFPILRFVDPQGSRKRLTNYFGRVFRVFDGIINERLEARASATKSKESNDVLDSLLNVVEENNSEFSLTDLKHLLLDIFIAGIDSTASILEWAMTELLRNPKILAKAQKELREVHGKDGINQMVEEFEMSKFPYLLAIIKETFRLHPSAPFLVPHKADTEVNILGFTVPKNAQILVNVWAMGRDSNTWPNPNSFVPERFLECRIDVKGRDFELIPFGSGRRICPGLPLAFRMLHLMLASLVYTYDWKLANGLKPENVDMSEKFGVALHKVEPLLAIPIKV